jgi:hypothetical protein
MSRSVASYHCVLRKTDRASTHRSTACPTRRPCTCGQGTFGPEWRGVTSGLPDLNHRIVAQRDHSAAISRARQASSTCAPRRASTALPSYGHGTPAGRPNPHPKHLVGARVAQHDLLCRRSAQGDDQLPIALSPGSMATHPGGAACVPRGAHSASIRRRGVAPCLGSMR